MGIEAGMRAMLERRQAELDAGAEPIGWKVGITVDAVQQRLGITEPVVGYLTSATRVDPGELIDISGWSNPVLEPELAIRVGEHGEVAALGAAIELVEIDLPFERIEPILAGNVFHRAFCFGPERSGGGGELRCRVLVDGTEVASVEVAGDPAATVAHVASFLAAHGARLAAGDRVIGGSLIAPTPVSSGSRAEVDLGPFGSVALAFA